MNSAVALGKLGNDTHFLGRLSNDAFGLQLRQHILAANVQLDLATESSQATSIAVVSPGAEVLLEWMRDVKAGVSYDINVRPTVITDPETYWGKVQPWLRAVGRRSGIVKASDEDIKFLAEATGARGSGGTDPIDVAAGWVDQYGLAMSVITLGPGGGAAVEPGGKVTRVSGFPTTVVDTVGAGDTFMAGFLDARVKLKLGLEDSLRRGAAAASIVCSRRGAQPPTSAEVDDLIAAG